MDDSIHVVSPDEGLEMLDRQTRRYLGMSGIEFLRRWDAGEYADDPDQPGVRRVADLIPFARQDP